MIIEYLVPTAWLALIPAAAWWINRTSARDLRRFERFVEAFLGRRVVEAGEGWTDPAVPPTRQAPAGLSPSQPVGALSSRTASPSPCLAVRPPISAGAGRPGPAAPAELQGVSRVRT